MVKGKVEQDLGIWEWEAARKPGMLTLGISGRSACQTENSQGTDL